MIGQLVTSKAGHDKNNLYMIVAEDGEYVFLADGVTKSPEHPKKKKRKHIQTINHVENTMAERLKAGAKIYPEEIRLAIKQFNRLEKQ